MFDATNKRVNMAVPSASADATVAAAAAGHAIDAHAAAMPAGVQLQQW